MLPIAFPADGELSAWFFGFDGARSLSVRACRGVSGEAHAHGDAYRG